MDEIWQALSREAAVAAEHMAIGASSLSKANYAQHAYYGQAFFALSIGFERSCKLALLVDHALEHNGQFPSGVVLRRKSHNLRELLDCADEIAVRRGLLDDDHRMPRSAIHDNIVDVLTDFADNLTRYYNLDLVTGESRSKGTSSPVQQWAEKVTAPILAKHYTLRQKRRHERNANLIAELTEGHMRVSFHRESGDDLTSVFEASVLTGQTEFIVPFTRMYVLQIARFLANLLSDLGRSGPAGSLVIPYFADYFAVFFNDDAFFRRRKTWSIY